MRAPPEDEPGCQTFPAPVTFQPAVLSAWETVTMEDALWAWSRKYGPMVHVRVLRGRIPVRKEVRDGEQTVTWV